MNKEEEILLQKELDKLWGGWKVDKELGEGSFGKVYRIAREDFGHIYDAALKVIKIPQNQAEVKSILNDGMDEKSATLYFRSVVEDIVEEFVLMSKMKGNTNIVSYEDHVVIPQQSGIGWNIFIRMELLTPLFDHLTEHQFSVRDIICLGIDICSALEVCQKYNIIHRDIKPENIFVSDLGKYKLGDFGIARQLEKTSSGLSKKGTYSYMAPEVYKGEKYNSTVDIYSLGLVLYRFLNNNRTPFLPAYPIPISYQDKEKANVMRMSGAVMPEPCHAKGRLAEIVLKACAYDPKERYESAVDMKKALEAVLYEKEEASLIYPTGDQLENEKLEYAKSIVQRKEESAQSEFINFQREKENNGEDTYILFGEGTEYRKAKKQEKEKAEEAARKQAEEERKRVEEVARKQAEEERKRAEEVVRKQAEEKKKAEEKEKKQELFAQEQVKKQKRTISIKKYILIIVVCLVVVGSFGGYKFYQKSLERKVPNLVNLTVEAAAKKAAADDESLKVEVIGSEYSDNVEKGNIISQNIKEGTILKKGDKINVIISKGKLLKVPNLVGLKTSEAKELLKEENLIYKTLKKEYSDDIKKGYIISQDLEAGSDIEELQTVSVVVSRGVEQVTVPNVEGKSQKEAEEALKAAKLKSSITKDYSSNMTEGKIISQSIAKNKKVDKNTEIKLVVSLGKKPEPKKTSYGTSTKSSSSGSSKKKKSSGGDSDTIDSWDLVN